LRNALSLVAGSERIVRVACEQAMQRAVLRGKQPVLTIVHKANVLKLTDGLFRECALKVAAEFPEIKVKELLVDSAAMNLVKSPQSFDVLVTTNLFGDIPRMSPALWWAAWAWLLRPIWAAGRRSSNRCTAPHRILPGRALPTPVGRVALVCDDAGNAGRAASCRQPAPGGP